METEDQTRPEGSTAVGDLANGATGVSVGDDLAQNKTDSGVDNPDKAVLKNGSSKEAPSRVDSPKDGQLGTVVQNP